MAVAGRVNEDVSKASELARDIVRMEEEEKVQPPFLDIGNRKKEGN